MKRRQIGNRIIEHRAFPVPELRIQRAADGAPRIEGHAAVFDSWSEDLGGFKEIIRAGAFKKTIREADIKALWQHDHRLVLGRNKAGTLKLAEDHRGLKVGITPPETTWAADAVKTIERGDVDQMSFGFWTVSDRWGKEDGENMRELLEVGLYDVSPVTFPAYPETDVQVRSILHQAGIDLGVLSSAIVRFEHGMDPASADRDVLQQTVDTLTRYLAPAPAQEGHAGEVSGDEADRSRRLALLRRRCDLAMRS